MTKLNRQEAIDKYSSFPLQEYNPKTEEIEYFAPKTFAGYILTLPAKTFKGRASLLGIETKKLITKLAFGKLIFLGDTDAPWLKRRHNFKHAKEGLEYLASKKIGKKFNGALQVGRMELPEFIKHLAWLARTNAVISYVHFMDDEQTILGSVCQYGNIHIYAANERSDKQLKEAVSKTKFEYVTGNC